MDDNSPQHNTPTPDVSVVIPTWNRSVALRHCLDALAEQTHKNYEVVVVNDNSTDDTIEMLEQFAAKHPSVRIKWLTNEQNIGANRSRNRGIRASAGQLVAFTDSDCRPAPQWLENLVKPFATDPKLASVTGTVDLPKPRNIFERTYRGTNRVEGTDHVNRLLGGNMCLRKDLLLAYPLDEDLKYGCDEEGVYLRLKAAGYRQGFAKNANVLHEHYFTGRSLLRQARVGGAAAAWLVHKYHLPPRIDMIPFILAYLTLPLAWLDIRLALLPAGFFAAALAAITYNDLFRKRKSLTDTIVTFPVLLAYYHCRLVGYLTGTLRAHLGLLKVERIKLNVAEKTA
jgi:glycosyltransferase involved in cell wall biosynthesis